MSAPVQPVIIVKKKGGHHGHHGGAWKVAYADFVTAMMAFFLVMWLVGQSPKVKAGVGGYFRDPVSAFEGGKGVLPGADTVSAPTPDSPITDQDSERKRLEEVVTHIKDGLDGVPAFQQLRDQVEFTVTPEGLRIDLVEKEHSSFFDSGSATLRGESINVLGVIASELGQLDHQLDVEGHTDSQQFSPSTAYSNWELSADRANAARRVLERGGIRLEQVTSVRGLADRELRIPDNPLDARNRRVSIMVKSPIMAKTSTAGMAVASGESVSVVAAPPVSATETPAATHMPAGAASPEPAHKAPAQH